MKRVVTFSGSPRNNGNSSLLLRYFTEGCLKNTPAVEMLDTNELNLEYCRGCLRCNILKKCSLRTDDWTDISNIILQSDVLVFASPVYFHHLVGPMKKLIDRFRCFVNVQITESGLKYTPWHEWRKDFVLILSMGSSDDSDAQPVIDLFEYICSIMGSKNRLHVVKGTRLAVARQVEKNHSELRELYHKLRLPLKLAREDAETNKQLLDSCFILGEELSR